MAVLAECPVCHKRQATKNKLCSCGESMDKAKRSNRVKYWITYRLPGGKQRREYVGKSIEEAKDANGKRRGQKRENRIFEIKPEANMTFNELTQWYFGLDKIKNIKSFPNKRFLLNRFNEEFGEKIVGNIKPVDLENYQEKRKIEGRSNQTIDLQIGEAKAMIKKAFHNDMIDGEPLKVFERNGKLLKKHSNARKKIISPVQFNQLMLNLPPHTKGILATGFYTGMRLGEITNLTWDKVSLKERVIRLGREDTKDKEARDIPICNELLEILNGIPRALHDNHVFLFRGKTGKKPGKSVKNIRKSLKTTCEKVGIPYGRTAADGFIFHDLRHSFNTYMRKAGIPESVIMDITGHSTREMFLRYDTVDRDDKQDAIRKFAGFLQDVSANVDQNVDQTPFLR